MIVKIMKRNGGITSIAVQDDIGTRTMVIATIGAINIMTTGKSTKLLNLINVYQVGITSKLFSIRQA